ncbi:WecB/TagA/CpsF family glycosyltransferase, partial [Thermodesulfobacteriota bacterium]
MSQRFLVLGVPVDHIDMTGACRFVQEAISGNKRNQVILAVNPEKIMVLQRTPSLKSAFESASLLLPDGIGVVWAMRSLRRVAASRVAGVDLMQAICRESAQKSWNLFVYGSREIVNQRAVQVLKSRFPGICIVGRENGYITLEEM